MEVFMHNIENTKKELLEKAKIIAVIGLSDDPDRTSYRVAKYLQGQGYKIVPVNPNIKESLGEKAYASLSDIPFPIDIVDIFRRSEEVMDIIKEANEKQIPAIWIQSGIDCPQDGEHLAKETGMKLIKNCCMMVEHKMLIG